MVVEPSGSTKSAELSRALTLVTVTRLELRRGGGNHVGVALGHLRWQQRLDSLQRPHPAALPN